jgi:hypothetical protein
VADSYEHDNKPSGSVKGEEFLDKLRDCQLLKKDSLTTVKMATAVRLHSLFVCVFD